MRVVYVTPAQLREPSLPGADSDVLELIPDGSDEPAAKSRFLAIATVQSNIYVLGTVRLLFKGMENASSYLESRLKRGWNGEFPLEGGVDYVSVVGDFMFYEQLMCVVENLDDVRRVSDVLHDAGCVAEAAVRNHKKPKLLNTDRFRRILSSEPSTAQAYEYAWRVLRYSRSCALDFGLWLKGVVNQSVGIDWVGDASEFRIVSDNLPPRRDINVLVEQSGEFSPVLDRLARSWVDPERRVARIGYYKGMSIKKRPPFSQLIALAFNATERFPMLFKRRSNATWAPYRYIGLRVSGKASAMANDVESVAAAISPNDSVTALLHCLEHDQQYGVSRHWGLKLGTVVSALKAVIDFDTLALEVPVGVSISTFYSKSAKAAPAFDVARQSATSRSWRKRRLIPIAPNGLVDLNVASLWAHARLHLGVAFLKNGLPIELDAERQVFVHAALCMMGALHRNSLILIDQLETFLGPETERAFITLLETILPRLNSKALISTRAEYTVCHVPSDCLQVYGEGVGVVFPSAVVIDQAQPQSTFNASGGEQSST